MIERRRAPAPRSEWSLAIEAATPPRCASQTLLSFVGVLPFFATSVIGSLREAPIKTIASPFPFCVPSCFRLLFSRSAQCPLVFRFRLASVVRVHLFVFQPTTAYCSVRPSPSPSRVCVSSYSPASSLSRSTFPHPSTGWRWWREMVLFVCLVVLLAASSVPDAIYLSQGGGFIYLALSTETTIFHYLGGKGGRQPNRLPATSTIRALQPSGLTWGPVTEPLSGAFLLLFATACVCLFIFLRTSCLLFFLFCTLYLAIFSGLFRCLHV